MASKSWVACRFIETSPWGWWAGSNRTSTIQGAWRAHIVGKNSCSLEICFSSRFEKGLFRAFARSSVVNRIDSDIDVSFSEFTTAPIAQVRIVHHQIVCRNHAVPTHLVDPGCSACQLSQRGHCCSRIVSVSFQNRPLLNDIDRRRLTAPQLPQDLVPLVLLPHFGQEPGDIFLLVSYTWRLRLVCDNEAFD